MEQSAGQNPNQSFWQKNMTLLLVVGIIAVVAISYAATRDGDDENEDNNNTEQASGENTDQSDHGQNKSDLPNENQNTTSTGSQTILLGDTTASGKLEASDDQIKGSLMMQSDKGKIYVATRRDFSSLLGKSVILDAQGTLESFKFLNFYETDAVSATEEADQEKDLVQATGKLELSDDQSKGNYQIVSGPIKIYLLSQRDYSALVGSEVNLKANGTLQSFANARLSKE